MIQWGVVAAYVGPLIGAIVAVAGMFVWLGKRRDERVALQIAAVTEKLEMRISQVEITMAAQSQHLDRQDVLLSAASQAIARIEGRLQGPIQITGVSTS